MGVELSDRDVRRFRAASRALMSPLSHPTLGAWGMVVNESLCELFGAQRAALILPRRADVHFTLRDFDPATVEPFKEILTATEPGTNQYADRLLDHSMKSLRESGATAWTTQLAEHLSGIPSPEIPVFHDVLIPGMLGHMVVTGAAHDHGMAMCAVFHDASRVDPFGEARLELMELLAPSFEAGVRTLDRLEVIRSAVDTLLDGASEALLVYDLSGRELHRNHLVGEMLRREPEQELVLQAIARLVGRLARPSEGQESVAAGLRAGATAHADRIGTKRHDYSFHASSAAAGIFARGPAIVVCVRRATPLLPTPERLMKRYGLTPREADVAVRLALGQSNAEIAADLCRSPHTVRHHAEHVFAKIGIHTRKALGLKLLEGPSALE